MPRAVTLLALLALASGCARHGAARTAEVHGPDGGRFHATVYHFLTAANDYEWAGYVHDGESYREEMERHFAGRPPVASVRVDAADAEAGDAATVTALVSYADGTAGVVQVAQRKGGPAWLVDWPATRELRE
jgi:hypothetical protein